MGNFIGSSKSLHSVMNTIKAAFYSGNNAVLIGKPGIGKTALIRSLADEMDLHLEVVIGSQMDPTDVAGLPAIAHVEVNGKQATITDNTLPRWAHELITRGKGILFLDELSNSTPSVQAALLSLLQGRIVGGNHKLPEGVFIIAAMNAPEDAADGYELAPPMANRLIHVNFSPDHADFLEGMSVAWNETANDRFGATQSEREAVFHREIDIRGLIVGFLKNHGSLIAQMPDNEAEKGGAWPSYRSWDNVARLLAYLPADDASARNLAMKGAVGEACAQQFYTFEQSLRLPDYDTVMNDPEKIGWDKLDAASFFIILNTVVSRITEDNAQRSADVFEKAIAISGRADIAAALAINLFKKIREHVPEKTKRFALLGPAIKRYAPHLQAAGISAT